MCEKKLGANRSFSARKNPAYLRISIDKEFIKDESIREIR